MHKAWRISWGVKAHGPAVALVAVAAAMLGSHGHQPAFAQEARAPLPAKTPAAGPASGENKGPSAQASSGGKDSRAAAKDAAKGAAPASGPSGAASGAAEPAREAVAPPDIMQRLRERLARRMAGAASGASGEQSSPATSAKEAAAHDAHSGKAKGQGVPSTASPATAVGAAQAKSKPDGGGGGGVRVLTRAANGDIVLRAAPPSRPAAVLAAKPKGGGVVGAAAGGAAGGGAASAAASVAKAWAYEGEAGPAAWAGLKAEYGLCAKGKRQSPIALQDGIAVDLEPIVFQYQSSGFTVIDTGHTVEVRLPPGSAIEVRGRRYALKQFHFHRPSEEHINGRGFEMSIHLVHADEQGRLAVVALVVSPGQAQGVVQSVWNNLPLERNEEWPARGEINPAELLPAERGYYTYMGSLSTPPCSEGVLWLVLQQALELSAEQISIFSRLYPMNARPLQPAHGRLVKQSR
jgi:carbonic anhydrase